MPEEDEDISQPEWVSPWGAAAFVAATLALLQAQLLGLRLLTLGLAVLGLVLVGLGVQATQEDRETKDRVWFYLAGAMNGVILVLALFLPGVLNTWWGLDTPVPRANLNAQVLVPRDLPLDNGTPLAATEAAEAATEGIRQEDVFVCVESVKVGPLPGTKTPSYLLVHLRLATCRAGTFRVEGFDQGERRPVLTDESGTSYPFQEQRRRREAQGAPVFEVLSGPLPLEVKAGRYLGLLLVFTAPPSGFGPLNLELPAAVWGRKGICKFHISQPFVAPDPKKGDSKP